MNEDIKKLALAAVNNTPVANYSQNDVEFALREELKKIAGNAMDLQKNIWEVFALIQEVVDEVLPKRVDQIFAQFAEVKQIGQGNKASFKRKLGRRRAKTFITKVSPAGVYESFRLDSESFDVQVEAIGANARIDWERYLDGSDSMAELVDIILEGIEEAIYKAIYNELVAMYNTIPAANKGTASNVDNAILDRIIAVVKSYGNGATIYCSELLASKLLNEVGASNRVPDADLNDIRTKGYVGMYKSCPVVALPISTEDDNNSKWAYDPSYCFILPNAGDKTVKVVLEGDLQMNQWNNKDWSMEIGFYKKFGTALLVYNNIGIYKDSSLKIDVL